MPDLTRMPGLILSGDGEAASALAREATEAGIGAEEVVEYLTLAMDQVGRQFENGEVFLPEMLVAASAMKATMTVLDPLLADSEIPPVGTVVIGTVQGDVHDIGKNIVASMLIGGGFNVHDLGVDAKPAQFITAVQERSAGIVALSAMLSTTMPAMNTTIRALEDAGLRDRVKVIVGGAPITQAFADEIGADGFAPAAGSVVDLTRRLIEA